MPIKRRRITLTGTKPIQKCQYRFEEYYVYGAIAPITGDNFFLDMPEADGDCFQVFANELGKEYNDSLNILLIDNASYHKAKKLIIPDNIVLLPIPPYSPELNPIERFWQDVKDKISFSVFKDLTKMRNKVDKILCGYSKKQLKSLTGYDYIINGL